MIDRLTAPYGGKLVNLLVDKKRAEELNKASKNWLSWNLSMRQLCDLELMLNGSFSPLTGFMVKKDYESVCSSMYLSDNTIWPMPVVLDVTEDIAIKLKKDQKLALRDPEGVMLAVLNIEDVWLSDRVAEVKAIYATTDKEHPGVDYLLRKINPYYLGGRIQGLQLPKHYDFPNLRLTPKEVRYKLSNMGWPRVAGYHAADIMHRDQYELTRYATNDLTLSLLIQPEVGMMKPGDINYYTKVRCWQALLHYYPKDKAMLALLPLSKRSAQPRETIWQAIISKNYGCSHFITESSFSIQGDKIKENNYCNYSKINQLLAKFDDKLGISIIPAKNMVYMEKEDAFFPKEKITKGRTFLSIREYELKELLYSGKDIPYWFTFPEIANELKHAYPMRNQQGFTVFFTGLSGSGKSTIARALMSRLMEIGGRSVTLLDGDIVRKHLSSELGFSREHRDINIRRIGFVASEITKNGGISICAPIAPYNRARKDVRSMITPLGGFYLVHISTPLEVCEAMNKKGLYAKAKAGLIKEFTGISDPYEFPDDAEMVIDTTAITPGEAVQQIITYLKSEGYLTPD